MEEKQNNKNADVGTQFQGDIKTLYDRYCDCRDQELDRFWKNSTYVWIFLAVCFGAFGQVILKYFEFKQDNAQYYFDLKKTYETLLSIISFIGLLCSFIWVWMARGMKAWYEVFEMAIWNMENDNALKLPEDYKYKIENFWRIKDSRFVWQKAFFGAESNSPSKIVILIGRLLCLVWFFAFLWALMSIFNILPFENSLECGGWIFLFLFIAVVVIYFCHFFIQGSVLKTDGETEFMSHLKKHIKEKIGNNCHMESTIIRYLWCRTFMIDIKGMKKPIDIKDFKCLEGNEDSKYFIIKTVTNVNGNMIKIRCRAKNWWSDLLNKDRYNLHTEDAKV